MSSDLNISVIFNGEKLSELEPCLITEFIEIQQLAVRRFVVVINDEMVPQQLWETTWLRNGDRIDIFSPISGG
jgi:thiamine biosynthesis protein ThiS